MIYDVFTNKSKKFALEMNKQSFRLKKCFKEIDDDAIVVEL